MTFDPPTAPWGRWALTTMTNDWVMVCCNTPAAAHHANHCPQTPIFARMVKDTGDNPLAPSFWPIDRTYWPWPR